MQPPVRDPDAADAEGRRTAELERRIRLLEELDDGVLGRFTAWDWWVCVLGALVAPVLVLWWFAG